MDSTGKSVLTLTPLSGNVRTPKTLVFFVLNSEEFVLRDEGEIF